MRLAKILIDKGLVNQEQMSRALEYKSSKRIRLDRALIQIGAVSEKDLLTALGEHLNMPLVNLVQAPVDPEVVKLLPPKLVYRRRVMPLWRRDGLLEVAISNPLNPTLWMISSSSPARKFVLFWDAKRKSSASLKNITAWAAIPSMSSPAESWKMDFSPPASKEPRAKT